MHTRRPDNAGFTLIELLTAMTILSLMLFMINQLFQSTSEAVTRSVQNSKVIAATRIINEQIELDAAAMQGPDDGTRGGYIVIIQERLNDVAMIDPNTLAEVEVDGLRSDQLVFIRDAAGLRSITPNNANGTYGSNLVGQTGDVAKVWYGHARRSNFDGTRTGTGNAYALGGDSAGADRIANNWVFARQALLFNPTDLAASPPRKIAGNGYAAADNANFNSPVNSSYPHSPDRAFMGLTDVTTQDYVYDAGDSTHLLTQLIDENNETTQNNFYRNTAYPFANAKLHVNPGPTGTNFEPWAVAQTHAILNTNCSEVRIDFAADLDGNGQIDTAPRGQSANPSAPIYWYDAVGKGLNNLQWLQQNSPTIYQPLAEDMQDYKMFVFRVNDDAPYDAIAGGTQRHSYWPYLIRIRYRLHDTRGRLMSNDPSAQTDGVDNDGDGDVDESKEDQISGRWVETIIRVPRP